MKIPALIDRFGRRIEYLRLSVTDRCDLRCTYCIPRGYKGFEEPGHWLDFDEIEYLIRLFADLGIKRLRLTGGEPLLRRNLIGLCGRLSVLPGIEDLSISTNATRLCDMAGPLKAAGVARLNVSLDSLRPEDIFRITGRAVLDSILAGLEVAREVGFNPIKVNMVVMRENSDEIDNIVAYCMVRGFVLRLIELMPMGETARRMGYIDLQPVKDRLRRRFGLVDTLVPGGGPAGYLGTPDGRFNVGFITPISQHFCANCNRLRLTVDGVLYPCLSQNARVDLRTLLRSGAGDDAIVEAIQRGIDQRPKQHDFTEASNHMLRFMNMTGG